MFFRCLSRVPGVVRPVAGMVILLLLSAPAGSRADESDSAASGDESVISLLLGYSFGYASFDAQQPLAGSLDNSASGNEPLLAVVAELNRTSTFGADVRLALASFGNVVGDDEEQNADVRRSILADLVLRWNPSFADSSFFLSANGGFVFDAQDDTEGTGVTDAKSYLMLGPQLRRTVGSSEIGIDLFFGASEVMTDTEIPEWHFGKDDMRIRPRITFNLRGGATPAGKENVLVPLTIGLWGDLGFSEQDNDTFVMFIARPIWSTSSSKTGP